MGCSVYARMGSTFHKLRLLSDVEESQDVLDEASARNCKRARQSSWKDATVAPRKEETNREEERIKSAVEILNSSSVIADGSAVNIYGAVALTALARFAPFHPVTP